MESGERGFSLAEFLISSTILLVLAGATFTMMGETQRNASYQTEVQAVSQNARSAMDAVGRCVRNAGNDPFATGFPAISIVSGNHVRVRSDLTGLPSGDPDGDTNDAGEDVSFRYNAAARTIEVMQNGGTWQAIAGNITAFALQYFDATGAATAVGANVRKVRVNLAATSTLTHPQTRQPFGMTLSSEFQLVGR